MNQTRADAFHAAVEPGAQVTIGATGDTFQANIIEAIADGSPTGRGLHLDESPYNPMIGPGTFYSITGDEDVLICGVTSY